MCVGGGGGVSNNEGVMSQNGELEWMWCERAERMYE